MTSTELAARTGTDERYLCKWLASQTAGGYVTYDARLMRVPSDKHADQSRGQRRRTMLRASGTRRDSGSALLV